MIPFKRANILLPKNIDMTKWSVEHFLLYSNRLENKGRVYVDNYFFEQCSKPNNTDLYNPNHDNNLNIFKSLNIERKKHLCKK